MENANTRDIEIAKKFLDLTRDTTTPTVARKRFCYDFGFTKYELLLALTELDHIPNFSEMYRITQEYHTQVVHVVRMTRALIQVGWVPTENNVRCTQVDVVKLVYG